MKKIAIIGSGISGLYAAYLLYKDYEITLYEKENYLGGHTRTLNIEYQKNIHIISKIYMIFPKRFSLKKARQWLSFRPQNLLSVLVI